MDRALRSLSLAFRPIACEIIACCVERGVQVMIVQTSRTQEEHVANLASGASMVPLSKHLPRRLRGWAPGSPDADKADAIDLAPYAIYQLHGADKLQWDDTDPAWAVIGQIAETFHEVRWGGRWQKPHDVGHIELLFPGERYRDIPVTAAAFIDHGFHA